MHLVLSGEGASDVGSDLENIGPITKLVDRAIDRQLGYSLVEYQALTLFSKAELAARAKQMKPRSRKGKKQPGEPATRLLLNDKIDAGAIDIDRIKDMPSLTAFKKRLQEVLNLTLDR